MPPILTLPRTQAPALPDRPPQPVAGEALRGLGVMSAHAIADNSQFELWSRLAAQQLQ